MQLTPVGILILALTASARGDEGLRIAVSPATAFAPADVTVRAVVEADPDNRAVEVVAESADFYRSSEMPLDGDRAPRTTTIQFRSLPAGNYEVRATLRGANGETRTVVRRVIDVLDRTDE